MIDKKATIKDVARCAGVSAGVVSFVLNDTPGQTIPEETRQRVFEAVKQLNYIPSAVARGMRTRKTNTLGLVCFWDPSEYIFAELLDGAYKAAEEEGYNIIICSLKSIRNEFGYVNLFRRQQVDGILLASPYQEKSSFSEKEHIRVINENRIPAVVIHGSTNEPGLSYVNPDYSNTTNMAVDYLIGLGHKNIGYILPEAFEQDYKAEQRLKGFKEALAGNNFDFNPSHTYKLNEIKRIENDILQKRITGIVAYKSEYAYSLMKSLLKAGISIPGEVSIIAANTTPFAPYLFPALSTVHIPFGKIGEKGVEILLKRLKDSKYNENLSLANDLCIRESCTNIK